jgi:signal transduction histidine kinase
MSGRRQVRPSGRTILVVDDQSEMVTSLRALLEREGHRVLGAYTGTEALAVLEQESVQVMIVDSGLPGMSGEELVGRVREHDPLLQIILQTGQTAGRPLRERVAALAIQGYHHKGDDPARLLLWVEGALRTYEQLAQLHVAERLKTELLANVSHEFRTPLNVIAGYVELVRDGTFGPCPAEAGPVFDKVLANTGYLLQLVEEFLDLARFEAGGTAGRREAIELTPFLRELGEGFALLVRAKPVAFLADVPEGLPAILVEGAKLRVVVQNLLANAEKFTQQGHIRLAATLRPDGQVAIEVSDTGPGIPLEHHEAIFDIFHQVKPHDGARKGVGLGLALARRFARLMGGDIAVASTLGAGTTFTVVLPTARSLTAAA